MKSLDPFTPKTEHQTPKTQHTYKTVCVHCVLLVSKWGGRWCLLCGMCAVFFDAPPGIFDCDLGHAV